jgi:hypothetical protein
VTRGTGAKVSQAYVTNRATAQRWPSSSIASAGATEQDAAITPKASPLASWFGRVRVALPGEDWPATNGAPMLALAQLNLRELPCPPLQVLADVALLTVFLGPGSCQSTSPTGSSGRCAPTPPWMG